MWSRYTAIHTLKKILTPYSFGLSITTCIILQYPDFTLLFRQNHADFCSFGHTIAATAFMPKFN